MATDPAVQAAAKAMRAWETQGWAPDERPDPEATDAYLDALAAVAVAAVTPLIRAQAFTEAADKVKAECAHGDMHYGNFDPDRCPICSHFIAAVRGLGEETASVDSKINTT